LQIPFPSYPEQTAIAEVLTDMDAEFAALAGKLKVEKMIELLEKRLAEQERLEEYRSGSSIWVLHPGAGSRYCARSRTGESLG